MAQTDDIPIGPLEALARITIRRFDRFGITRRSHQHIVEFLLRHKPNHRVAPTLANPPPIRRETLAQFLTLLRPLVKLGQSPVRFARLGFVSCRLALDALRCSQRGSRTPARIDFTDAGDRLRFTLSPHSPDPRPPCLRRQREMGDRPDQRVEPVGRAAVG